MFEEMRLAAVLQAMRKHPGVLPARDVLWMATRAGARTLGLDAEIGSLEAGKRADLIVLDLDRLHNVPAFSHDGNGIYGRIVYASKSTDVVDVMSHTRTGIEPVRLPPQSRPGNKPAEN